MHRVSSTCYPKQAEAKNSQTKGLQNAFLLPELHFQSRAVVFSLLNLSLQPWNKHATFCSKILRFFWRVRSFTVKRDSTLPCADPFPELQELAGFAQPKLAKDPQAVFSWDSQQHTLVQLWEELCTTVEEGNQIPEDAQPFLWEAGTLEGVWKLPLKPLESVPCWHFLVLRGKQTAKQEVLNSECGGYFF